MNKSTWWLCIPKLEPILARSANEAPAPAINGRGAVAKAAEAAELRAIPLDVFENDIIYQINAEFHSLVFTNDDSRRVSGTVPSAKLGIEDFSYII